MITAVIVEAEWGRSALSLAPLGAGCVLQRVLERAARIDGLDALACVLPEDRQADDAAEEAARCGALVVRGPASDPLGAYARAACETRADLVLRLAGDRPFIDAGVCGRVRDLLHVLDADYACNDLPATWPHGLDCEAFSARLLHWADALADNSLQRRSVTGWIRSNPDLKTASLAGPGGEFAHLRWLVEWPEDLAFAQAVFDALGERAAFVPAAELASLCLRRPDLAGLNAARNDMVRLAAGLRADFVTPPISITSVA